MEKNRYLQYTHLLPDFFQPYPGKVKHRRIDFDFSKLNGIISVLPSESSIENLLTVLCIRQLYYQIIKRTKNKTQYIKACFAMQLILKVVFHNKQSTAFKVALKQLNKILIVPSILVIHNDKHLCPDKCKIIDYSQNLFRTESSKKRVALVGKQEQSSYA